MPESCFIVAYTPYITKGLSEFLEEEESVCLPDFCGIEGLRKPEFTLNFICVCLQCLFALALQNLHVAIEKDPMQLAFNLLPFK